LETTSKIALAAELIANAQHAVALTGAGISTPSGIPDFRSPGDGLWQKVNPMLVASIYSFRLRPEAFYRWLSPLAKAMREAKPNAAHLALAQLEHLGALKAIITQNIDGLHQRAGSRRVLELHGNTREVVCTRCGYTTEVTEEMMEGLIERGVIPRCPHCDTIMKPNAVLFGEILPPRTLLRAQVEAERCDLMLIIGSSLVISPASDLPIMAHQRGADLIIINRQPTTADIRAAVVLREDVAEVLPQITEAFEEKISGKSNYKAQ